MSRLILALACLGLALAAVPLRAHHSFASEFDAKKPFKVSGTVTQVEWANPHVWFHADVKDPSGKVTRWSFEMGSPNNLVRTGWTRNSLRIGQVVVVEGFLARRSAHIGNARSVVLASAEKRLPPIRDDKPLGGGRADLNAPVPRTADGKPNLSGIWKAVPDPKGIRGGIEDIIAPRYMIDITVDMKPSEVPLTPWAAALYKARNDNLRRDNPSIRCLPFGIPRLDSYTHPFKIVQTPDVVVFLYESMTMFRQVFVDGRPLPKDPQPSWMGHSVGRWEKDVLVVESIGFNDKTWLDGAGHPHSDQMRVTERFHRLDTGHLNIDVTINDPKAYTKPLRYVQPHVLQSDSELVEYVCENAKAVGSE